MARREATTATVAPPQLLPVLLAHLLVEENLCQSPPEACGVVVAASAADDARSATTVAADLAAYLELTPAETESLCAKVTAACCRGRADTSGDANSSASSWSSSEESENDDNDNEVPRTLQSKDDCTAASEEECIGPGECVLCERHRKLTRHHLIPKATWKKLEHKVNSMPTLSHIAKELHNNRKQYKQTLHMQTIDVCSACHRHIHQTHDHWTLAISYNTLERLLEDPSIYKFAQWAHSQRRCSDDAAHHIISRGRRCGRKGKKK